MSDRNWRNRVSRRRLLRYTGTASVAATVGLAGCTGDGGEGDGGGGDGDGGGEGGEDGGDGGGGDGGDESVQLEVTGVWSGGEEEDFLAVVDYVQEQTGHQIEYTPRDTDALLSGTLLDYQGGNAPADIVVMPSPARIVNDGQAGHIVSLGDVWNGEDYAITPDRVSADGSVYAAPFKMDLKPGFWYRKSFFEENDLSEPESYDEFTSLLDSVAGIDGVEAPLASGNGDGWPLSDAAEAFFLRQENGVDLQEGLISGDVDFTDERVTSALQEIVDLHDQGYWSTTRDFGTQYEYMWDGTHPLYFMGSWTPAMDAVQDASDLGVFMLPETEGMVASVNWFTVPEYSENSDAAKEAVAEFVSQEGQQVWAERGGFIASHLDVDKSAYGVEVMAQLPEMANEVTVVSDLDDALGNPFQQEFWSQLKGLWSEPGRDLDSMQQSLDDAQDEALADN